MSHMRHSRCLLSTNIRSFLVKSLFYNTGQPCCRTDGNVILTGIFVSKTAGSVFFTHFPLVFSRKSIHYIMVTTDGLTKNEHWGDLQAEIQLDDLYQL